jgi:hypothetical protein
MNLHLGNTGEARRLPKAVREYMRYRFLLLPEYLDLLRCFEFDGELQGSPVKMVKIFSPAAARDAGVSIQTRHDLERHHDLLLYEGHLDGQGKAYVADRRAIPLKHLKK